MTSHSQFTKATEGEEVVSAFTNDIQEKTILITGISPNGLGAQFAQTLASKNPSLIILAGRDREKVQTVAATLAAVHPEVTTRILTFDLTSFSSVRSAAAEVMAYPELGIDILINNAGVMNIPERTLSPEGFEMHLATNYLGSFLFTNSILDKLVNNGGARIVNVSSQGYVFSPFRFSDYNFEGKPLPESEYPAKSLCDSYGLPWGLGYLPTIAYGQSKTAMLLYSAQLAKATNAKGITTVCVHPGAIATDLWRHIPKDDAQQLFTALPMKTISQGISTTLVAALDPQLKGTKNVYLEDSQLQPLADFATDPEKAEKLWKLSEDLVGQTFSA